jgi:hypothetical protein
MRQFWPLERLPAQARATPQPEVEFELEVASQEVAFEQEAASQEVD